MANWLANNATNIVIVTTGTVVVFTIMVGLALYLSEKNDGQSFAKKDS